MNLHDRVFTAWFSKAAAILLLRHVACLTFSVNLSSEISRLYYGQILAYFTFVDGGTASLSYESSGQVSPSAHLYLLSPDNHFVNGIFSSATCHNLYKKSLSSVSLNLKKRYVLNLDGFAGYFPTLLVFADNSSCNRTIPVFADSSMVTITLLNPHGQPLSGTLIGIPTHVAGLFSIYAVALLYTLHCLRCSKRCETCRGVDKMDSFSFSVESGRDTMSVLDSTIRRSSGRSCCSCTSTQLNSMPHCRSHSSYLMAFNGQEKRLCYMLALLCLQCSSSLLAWCEFSTLSRNNLIITHPVFGANGSRSHFAELFSLAGHYVFMMLLMLQINDSYRVSEHQDTKRTFRTATSTSNLDETLPRALPSPNEDKSFLPVLSAFRLGRTLSLNRFIWLLFCVQLVLYYTLQQSNSSVAYAQPTMWPTEEQHGFWAGLGIPTTNYRRLEDSASIVVSSLRSASPFTGFFARLHAMTFLLTGSTSLLSVLLSALRIGFGLVLSTRLVQIGRIQKFGELGSFCTRFGWLGISWFAAHPLLLLAGTLFADHIRYKVVLVGVTLIQVSVVISLLVLFTRRTLLWDISALSASLPLLKRIPSPSFR